MIVDTLGWYKVNLRGMVDLEDIVDNMVFLDNVNRVDITGIVNVQKTVGYLKLPVDTSGWKMRTW